MSSFLHGLSNLHLSVLSILFNSIYMALSGLNISHKSREREELWTHLDLKVILLQDFDCDYKIGSLGSV